MAGDLKTSPAVQAYEQEKARQREQGKKADLDQALEDTFPASDAVSHTITSVPAGRTDTNEAERVRAEPSGNGVVPKASLSDEVTKWVRHRPLAAVAIAAALGWVMGVSR